MVAVSRRACLKMLVMLPLAARAGLLHPDRQRIVTINWAAAETLLCLGVTPLAISDSGYFRRRIPLPALPASVQDIGPFWEPNLEVLDALRPSLIISDSLPATLMAQMSTIAPVEIFSAFTSTDDLWQTLNHWTAQMGTRLDVAANATRWLQQVQTEIATLRLHFTHRPPLRVLVMVLDQDGRYATIYGKGSLADAALLQLGLLNAWQKPVNAAHVARVRIEELADLPCDWLFFTELPTAMTRLMRARQPKGLWQQLPIIAAGRVTRLDYFFPFGSLATALGLAREITTVLAATA